MTLTEIIAAAGELLVLVKDSIALFMEPPIVYYVIFGIIAAAISIAKTFVPRKRAK